MSKRRFTALAGFAASALVVCSPIARFERTASADDAPASAAPPPLTLTVSPGASGGPWTLRVASSGNVPIRIAADPRLLVLDVTPPAGFSDDTAGTKAKRLSAAAKKADDAKPVRCALPDDARPATDEGHELVIPGSRSWSASIDPLLYCFSEHDRARLVVGATVRAHFGWPAPEAKAGARPAPKPGNGGKSAKFSGPTPPFVAAPVGAAVGAVAPAKDLEAPAFTLSDSATGIDAAAALGHAGIVDVTLPTSLDVGRGNEISVTVTLANDTEKPVSLLFRPETMRFNVSGPAGSVSCGTTRDVGSPIRELYTTLGAKSRTSITVLISAVCNPDTFDMAGIYRVAPVLDTSGASARSIGLKTWDGVATGRSIMLLRVRTSRRPTEAGSGSRPALD